MSILKCKICGGDLNIHEGSVICRCEYCGTAQTIPISGNEKKINLYNRANRLRMNAEFDKASAVYTSILAESPREAEAYWGLCLCKYGIEYVDDPQTAEKVPTCHRTLLTSILDDDDYLHAVEYADPSARSLYKTEARRIDELQQRILHIVKNEAPYDVFICYKETDDNGDRTEDSVMAHDIFDALTDKGLKVFFSRITLEDKIGQEYEPYIYAALQSGELESDVPLQDTEKIRREYGKELAIKLRWQHGMQVKDLAELFGVSRNTIGNWVNDSRPKPDGT